MHFPTVRLHFGPGALQNSVWCGFSFSELMPHCMFSASSSVLRSSLFFDQYSVYSSFGWVFLMASRRCSLAVAVRRPLLPMLLHAPMPAPFSRRTSFYRYSYCSARTSALLYAPIPSCARPPHGPPTIIYVPPFIFHLLCSA
jgi:hypothetical protein